jgi:hypothetical protein
MPVKHEDPSGIIYDENGEIGLRVVSPFGLFLFGTIAVCGLAQLAIFVIIIAKVSGLI